MNFNFNFNFHPDFNFNSGFNSSIGQIGGCHIDFTQVKPLFSFDQQSEPLNSNANINLKDRIKYILTNMPKTFTITTNNNNVCKFNIEFLKDSCQKISDFIKENPNSLQYHIDVDDPQNVMKQFELLFKGENVMFNEIFIARKIAGALGLSRCPVFLQANSFSVGSEYISIDTTNLISYFKNTAPKFTINTNSKEYKCSLFGVLESKVIYEQIINNPQIDHYDYNFANDQNEFDEICKIFNFEPIQITIINLNSLQKIAEDLQIEYILTKIDNFVQNNQNHVKFMNEQQDICDSYSTIFNCLYHIKDLTLETVKKTIIESDWVKTEEDVQELVACILQVIFVDFKYHQGLVDLLCLLDEEANTIDSLKILKPFLKEKLLFEIELSNLNCSFLYLLLKAGYVSKKEILEAIEKKLMQPLSFTACVVEWFMPEIYEVGNKKMIESSKISKGRFAGKYLPYKIDEFKKIRDRREPNDPIANAIYHDDVDKFKELIKDIFMPSIPYDLFIIEKNVKIDENDCLNYAASCGSVKCFKHLLSIIKSVNRETFKAAIFGGNREIIQAIEDQANLNASNKKSLFTSLGYSLYNPFSDIGIKINDSEREQSPITQAILKHDDELFDWLLDKKLPENDKKINLYADLADSSITNGNAHSFIRCFSIMNSFGSSFQNYIDDFIKKAFEKGFYKISRIISFCIDSNENHYIKDIHYSSIVFGNISIFKLALEIAPKLSDIKFNLINGRIMNYVVEHNYYKLFKYLIEIFSVSFMDMNKLFIKAFESKSIDILKLLLSFLKGKIFNFPLNLHITNDYIEIIEITTDILIESQPNYDFNSIFIQSALQGADEICKYFIKKKVLLDLNRIAKTVASNPIQNENIVLLIYDIIPPELRNDFLATLLNPAINNCCIKTIEFILKHHVPCNNELLIAVNTKCEKTIDMVKMILNKNNKPSFVNQIFQQGTVLSIAVDNKNVELVKLLLSVPGIDPSLYSKTNITPLIIAVNEKQIEIVKMILDFYGENIQKQEWQILECLNIITKKLSLIKIEMQSDKLKEMTVNTPCFMLEKNVNNVNANPLIQFDFSKITSGEKEKKEIKKMDDECLFQIIDMFLSIKNVKFNPIKLFLLACELNYVELVKKLMKNENVDVNAYSNDKGDTPLISAIKQKNVEIAEILIKFPKTNINHRNYDKETALTEAVELNLTNIVDLIINDDRFDPIESCVNEAFFVASNQIAIQLCSIKNFDVNKLLVPYKYLEKKQYIEGFKSCLMHAVMKGNNEMVDMIISHPTFDPVKSLLKSAIFETVRLPSLELFRKLINLVNNDVNIRNKKGQSLLVFSAKLHHQEIVEEILNSKKFDAIKSDILSSFVKSFTNLGFADKSLSIKIMNLLANYDAKHQHLIDFKNLLPSGKSFFTSILPTQLNDVRLTDFFIERGVDPDIPDKSGTFPLQYAIENKAEKCIKSLLKTGKIDLSRRICNGNKTYLHLAMHCDNDDVARTILFGCVESLNEVDEKGETPLFEAVRMKKGGILRLFFSCENIDYKHKNKSGMDALAVARQIGVKNAMMGPSEKKEEESEKEYYRREILSNLMLNS